MICYTTQDTCRFVKNVRDADLEIETAVAQYPGLRLTKISKLVSNVTQEEPLAFDTRST